MTHLVLLYFTEFFDHTYLTFTFNSSSLEEVDKREDRNSNPIVELLKIQDINPVKKDFQAQLKNFKMDFAPLYPKEIDSEDILRQLEIIIGAIHDVAKNLNLVRSRLRNKATSRHNSASWFDNRC